ncbi:Rhodanese-like domain containing protein [Melia azedarach]|uniref:Rhodanese-like domain containing protein n=1 Tax=Melia azedarach TaxID=155640 RepID=A0ACC1XTW4_MELAZ|nr:Rhodanese-like domain containing protein [Melia azedarach]
METNNEETVEEYERGHVDAVAKTVNVPHMFDTPRGRVKNPNFLEEVASFTKEYDGWLVGSETGVRSLHATTDLINALNSIASNYFSQSQFSCFVFANQLIFVMNEMIGLRWDQHWRRISGVGAKWI